jgi:hypothetical protein
MQNNPEIKLFAQETLGCTCPEEVFNKIEYNEELNEPWERRINIGDRLLIYIINIGPESDLVDKVNTALRLGVTERNEKGFNRFRLVLVSSDGDEVRDVAEREFSESAYQDEKTHLHILGKQDIPI